VHQHQRALAFAAELVAQSDAVGFDEIHAAFPASSCLILWPSASFAFPPPKIADIDVNLKRVRTLAFSGDIV
jgi:hypothetical protein